MGNNGKTNGEKPKRHGSQNLKPAVKGEPSRNPNGRGKGVRNRSTILRELLALTALDEKGNRLANPLDPKCKRPITNEIAIDAKLVGMALAGDLSAIREVKDTIFGKIKDQHEITGKDGAELAAPVQNTIVNAPVTLNDAQRIYKDLLKGE